ncbi:hypothetical protein GQ607_008925 [Colletotrichum asianum]|uniref:Uncharacterized protein n=1 Tax=Colletotrichum asianum TaxID=702518 RepID=A0A8H3W9R1_9PEZI|nr:hypothetical protein GQ607_008925 [Colletotrichum asianum]
MPDDWKESSLMTRSFTKSFILVYSVVVVGWSIGRAARCGLMTLVWFLIQHGDYSGFQYQSETVGDLSFLNKFLHLSSFLHYNVAIMTSRDACVCAFDIDRLNWATTGLLVL